MVNCVQCDDTGLERGFVHVSFPAHSPRERVMKFEAFDPLRERRWETEDGFLHRLYVAHRLCGCSTGVERMRVAQQRTESKQQRGKKGWEPTMRYQA